MSIIRQCIRCFPGTQSHLPDSRIIMDCLTIGLVTDVLKKARFSSKAGKENAFVPPTPAADLHAQLEPLEKENEGIFLLTLNRPEEKNAIGRQMLRELRECVQNLATENSIRCVILRSSVKGVFSAGVDLNERENMTQREQEEFLRDLRDTVCRLEHLSMPTIATIDGYAIGAGAEIALACDLRIGGADAKLAFPETRLGMIPCLGATQRLPRLVGYSKAKQILFTGQGINSFEAQRLGLLDTVQQDSCPLKESVLLGREIAASAPLAVKAVKLAINLGAETDLSTGLKIEEACIAGIRLSKDKKEGLRAFIEKRNPEFVGE
eukprot:jgi/Picsp_1/1670/NSC_05144-R1_au rna binding protein enoyl-coenzyme a hydratase